MTNTISHSFWESGIWASLSWLVLALSHQDVGRDHLESSKGLSVAGGFAPSLGSLTWLWQESPVSCLKVFRSLQHAAVFHQSKWLTRVEKAMFFFSWPIALEGEHCHSQYVLLFRGGSPSPSTPKGEGTKLHFQSNAYQRICRPTLKPAYGHLQ